MKIEAITLHQMRMPLVHFFETSFSRTYEREILLVCLHTDGGSAWGECVAAENPYYSDEWIGSAWATLEKFLVPAVMGKTFEKAGDCASYMAKVRGHRMAKAAIENALWVAEAEEKNIPLWKVLGGKRKQIECGVSIGIQDTIEQLLEKIETELAAGYRRIKVKVKPKWDVKVMARIRERWPDILLSCDANSAYTFEDFGHLSDFERFNLLMIEQPLWNDDFYFHARLQKRLKTPLCLDESIRQARDATAAIELGACRIINVKVGRVGGMSQAIRVHDVCQKHNVPVWCGGMLESGVGRAHNVHLSTLENFKLPGDVSASKRYWKEDVVEPEVEVTTDGLINVPDAPGTGYKVNERLIAKLSTRTQTIR
jgi:O-succinylbenzoate synthase